MSDQEQTEAARADYIKRIVDEAPPLTQSQRERIAQILRAGKRVRR